MPDFPSPFDDIIHEHGVRILDSIYDGILIVDGQSIVRYVNPEYLRIVQIEASDIIGKPLRSVRPGALLPDVVASGRSLEGAYRREGAIEYVVDMSPILSDGKIVGGISVVKDVTEVKRLAEELEKFQRSNKQLRSSIRRINMARYTFDDIVYESHIMEQIVNRARTMAVSSADVLITGESGTGKEVFAQAIHNASPRSRGPFLALNCATLSPSVIESELFGYGDGAFTGAKRGGKAGFFEVAEGGTLFLDEITELPLNAQAKLLRVLQERTVRRVGETDEIPMDVRVVTASNRNMADLVSKSLFRNDLFYRLNTLHLDLPPLRHREQDALILALFFFRNFIGMRADKGSLADGVTTAFLQYPWPGNIRELRNMVEYAVHMGAKERIKNLHLPQHIFASPRKEWVTRDIAGDEKGSHKEPASLAHVVMRAERNALAAKLREHGVDLEAKKRIAKELCVSLTTLYAKLNKYNL